MLLLMLYILYSKSYNRALIKCTDLAARAFLRKSFPLNNILPQRFYFSTRGKSPVYSRNFLEECVGIVVTIIIQGMRVKKNVGYYRLNMALKNCAIRFLEALYCHYPQRAKVATLRLLGAGISENTCWFQNAGLTLL